MLGHRPRARRRKPSISCHWYEETAHARTHTRHRKLTWQVALGHGVAHLHAPMEVTHDVSSDMLRSISAPEQLETRLGTLEFVDGVPTRRGRREGVRPPRLRARASTSISTASRQRRRTRSGRASTTRAWRTTDPHLLGADGLGVGVPDRERRHGLLPRRRRSHVGADGGRDASAGARGDRRHVVGLDHRLRPAGPGSRRRRPLSCSSRPATTARCRTAATTSDTRARRGRSCSGGRS